MYCGYWTYAGIAIAFEVQVLLLMLEVLVQDAFVAGGAEDQRSRVSHTRRRAVDAHRSVLSAAAAD
jgi:hypothetical protein